jgi:putative transposase
MDGFAGKWYVMFSCEWTPLFLPEIDEPVGVDAGLHSFATLSTGEQVENPKFFRLEEKALAKAQRKLSKTENGTPQQEKRRKVVARVHERIAWKRQNFAHQLSRKIVNRFGMIALEDIHVNRMLHNPVWQKACLMRLGRGSSNSWRTRQRAPVVNLCPLTPPIPPRTAPVVDTGRKCRCRRGFSVVRVAVWF